MRIGPNLLSTFSPMDGSNGLLQYTTNKRHEMSMMQRSYNERKTMMKETEKI